LILQRNLFLLRFRHQTSATKLRYLRSSTFHRQPHSGTVADIKPLRFQKKCHNF